ncbi:MAG: response regulator transcription factor [Polyangiales bacterium]
MVGPEGALGRPEGAVAALRELGCRVETADLWDRFDDLSLAQDPPTVVLIDALEEVDAGRAALVRVRAVGALAEVPVIIAVTVGAVTRLGVADGFDDFVLSPFVPAELYARVRRAEWERSEFAGHERIKVGDMVIDLAAHEVAVGDRPIELTQQEFALLRFLCQHRGRVFTRDQLLERVWGVDFYGSSRTVDVHIRRLRAKLGDAVKHLETIRGVGYKMKAP